MKRLVVDTSVIVKWLVSENEEHIKQADELMDDVQKGRVKLFSPELAKYEVGNALWKKTTFSESSVRILLSTLYSLPIQFVPETKKTAVETYKIAKSTRCTYYDASFLSLAMTLDNILVTDNIKHQKKLPKGKVIALENYK